MNNLTFLSDNCFCLPDCDVLKFSYHEKQLPIDLKSDCLALSATVPGYWQTIEKKVILFDFLLYRMYQKLQSKEISPENDFNQNLCLIMTSEDKFILEVQLEGQTFIKYKKSLRVTTADKFGNLGGTLGLFCGFSVLACFEVFHWICKILSELMTTTHAH